MIHKVMTQINNTTMINNTNKMGSITMIINNITKEETSSTMKAREDTTASITKADTTSRSTTARKVTSSTITTRIMLRTDSTMKDKAHKEKKSSKAKRVTHRMIIWNQIRQRNREEALGQRTHR